MTTLHRSVPQRRRTNLWTAFDDSAAFVIAELFGVAMIVVLIVRVIGQVDDPAPSRLQPVLDRTGVTGEVEVVR